MTRFQQRVLRAHGYRAGKRCTQARNAPELCPALSLPDLFSARAPGQARCAQLLDAVPSYFSQGVITRDRKTANLAFGIRLMPLDRQKQVVDDIERRLDPPPACEASVVGLPVLAAEANGALSSPWRRGLTLLAALAGVFLVLLAVRRRCARRPFPDPDRACDRLVGRRCCSCSVCCRDRSRSTSTRCRSRSARS